MASILGDGTGPGGPGTSRCLLLLQRSLAIQLSRGPPSHVANANQRESPKEHPADEMWMYDKGYNLFQVSCRYLCFIYIFVCIPLLFFYRVAIACLSVFQCLSINDTRVWHFRASFCSGEITGAGKVLRKRTSERKKKTRRVCRRRAPSLFVSSASFLPPRVDARILYGKADVDCPHRYTIEWDNVNYEQFRKSKHNRGAAG